MPLKERIIRWLEDHRELVVVLFCLPASFIFDAVLRITRNITRNITRYLTPGGSHEEKVATVQRKVQQWNKLPPSSRRLLCTSRPNWLSLSTTFFQKHLHHQVPIPLHQILSLDVDNMTVRVEPMVTIGEITEYLIPKGYSLAVIHEIPLLN